ncbi:Two pore calcium channel protein 2 [Cichlidogyrus casuarinus]|uniref:Two pore calcium channel protein 2 n=1 Tax=Cichlidogyrus casuarinus TaxID=1844966 RepID=A0ABD2QIN6_9PLAT
MILPFLENPSSLTVTSDLRFIGKRPVIPCGILEVLDMLCLLVCFANAFMQYYIIHRYTSWRKNKWLVFQLPLALISIIDVLVSISLLCTETVRIRRYIRLYFLLANCQMVKNTLPDFLGPYGQNRSNFLLFGIYLMFVLFVIMNIFTSIVYLEFKGNIATDLSIRLLRRRVATRAIFELLKCMPTKR